MQSLRGSKEIVVEYLAAVIVGICISITAGGLTKIYKGLKEYRAMKTAQSVESSDE